MFLSVSICFYLFFICFCLFLSVSICFYPVLSAVLIMRRQKERLKAAPEKQEERIADKVRAWLERGASFLNHGGGEPHETTGSRRRRNTSSVEYWACHTSCDLQFSARKERYFSEHLNWEVDWVVLHHKSKLTPTLWFAPTWSVFQAHANWLHSLRLTKFYEQFVGAKDRTKNANRGTLEGEQQQIWWP